MSDSNDDPEFDGPGYGAFVWEAVREFEPEGDGSFEVTVQLRERRSAYWARVFESVVGEGGPEHGIPQRVVANRSAVTAYGVRPGQEQDLRNVLERAAGSADAAAENEYTLAEAMAVAFEKLARFLPD